MNVRDGIARGRRIIAEQRLDLDSAKTVLKSLHPDLSPQQIELGLAVQVAALAELHGPYTIDSVAEQMANRSGAFPWNGPVGNGLTLDHYQQEFRRMAHEALLLREALGLGGDA